MMQKFNYAWSKFVSFFGRKSVGSEVYDNFISIQYCPKKATNYKEKTQERRRYHHPNISAKTLIKSNNEVKDYK